MRTVLAAFMLWVFSLSMAEAEGAKPPIVLRFYLQVMSQTGSNWMQVEVPDPPQPILIEKYSFLSEKYVTEATALPDGNTMIQFDPIGTNVLDTTTSGSTGKILVVICNSRVIYAPVIDQPLRQGRMIVPGITPEELKTLKEYIVKHRKG